MHRIGSIAYLKVHRIHPDGTVQSTRLQIDWQTHEVIERMPIFCDVQPLLTALDASAACGPEWFRFRSTHNFSDHSLRVIRLADIDNPNPLNCGRGARGEPQPTRQPVRTREEEANANEVVVDGGGAGGVRHGKRESKVPNIPMMIRCQNCDTNFPTKYQFQRHQCEFNAEKIVLKSNVDASSVEKGLRIKYDCKTCGKQFVSKNNLERHLTSHDEENVNICEYCNKHFVSENRLRIHKENHCKKAGDISKFYRSDITVWRCLRCYQVFSSESYAVAHSEKCPVPVKVAEEGEGEEEEEEMMVITLKEANEDLSEIGNDPDAGSLTSSTGTCPFVDKVKTELLLQCEFCNRNFANKKTLLWHQKTHTTANNFLCVVCNKTFESYVSAAKHWLTVCTIDAHLFYLPKLIYCSTCDRTFKSHEILYTHKIKKKHYCQKRHIEEAEVEEKKTEAPQPSEPEASQESIIEFIEDVLGCIKEKEGESAKEDIAEEPLDEEDNDEPKSPSASEDTTKGVTKKRRGRKRKLATPLGKGKKATPELEPGYKFQCERCVRVFETVADLEQHRNDDHPANYKCEECDQVVHSSKALMIHSRAHQSLKPYVCEICKRCYSQTSHLWQHMRFHQGIKPFACPHEGCEARYTIRPDLKDHIRKVHTRERPFRCTVCDKCFLTGSVYYQHRLIHTNDRRYACDVCSKRFFRADALNNHRRIHTDEKPYPCGACGRHFRQKGDRNKHMRTQHPGI